MIGGRLSQQEIFYGVVVGLIVAGVIYISKKAATVAAKALEGINPVSDRNIFYGGVNAVGGVLADTNDFTLGGVAYDYLNPGVDKVASEPSWLPLVKGGVLVKGVNRDLIR